MWSFFYKLASPKWFYQITAKIMPWLCIIIGSLVAYGLYVGLYVSPEDYQQGHSVRIMYIHVPSAFNSMMIYTMMATCAAIGYIWRIKLAYMVAISAAPVGAAFTFLALFTGAVWGKPTWGTWWVWDARITSELILLFLYLGYMALHNAIEDTAQADRTSAVLAMVGVVNVPVIHFSVYWWNSLHQKATISKFEKPSIEGSMLEALLVMIAAFILLAIALIFYRTANEVLVRERKANWVQALISNQGQS